MKRTLRPEEELLISRSLDGDLTPEEQESLDQRCSKDPAFGEELNLRRRLRDLLARTPSMPTDPLFATRVSASVKSLHAEERDLLPFPRKYLPAAAVAMTSMVTVAAFMVLQSRIPILRFWERQAETVRQAYEQTLSQGSFLPLLGNMDSERALQFAFTGTLALDEDKGTTLKVDDRSKDGYRIEVQKEGPHTAHGVTVAEFMSAVKPTHAQRQALDSVLNAAREELQTAVLVGANDEVAIKSDLRRLNRAVVSGLASCLEPEQRTKMSRFMTVRDAPYVLMGNDAVSRSSQEIVAALRPRSSRSEFVVLRRDSLLIARYHVNAEELRIHIEHPQVMAMELAARRDRMIRRWVNDAPSPVLPAMAPEATARVNMKSRRDRLSIEVNDSLNERVFFFDIGVTPRAWVEGDDADLEALDMQFQVAPTPGTLPRTGRVQVTPVPKVRHADSIRVKRRAFPVVVQ